MTRIYEYCREARWLAAWGWLVRPTLVREIEERDWIDDLYYDDGKHGGGES